MSEKRKQRPRQSKTSKPSAIIGVLKQFDCESVVYEFDIPLESFNSKAFARKTGLTEGDHWTTVLPSENRLSGYHIHFKGSMESKRVRLTIEYWDLPVKRAKVHPPEPYAESIMPWLGSFIREPISRAVVLARFQKPVDAWRSRFNLPFKVTMGDAEVVIDGVSLILPRNLFRAMNGWITKAEHSLFVSADFAHSVEFSRFDIGKDLTSFNEAIKIFVEQIA